MPPVASPALQDSRGGRVSRMWSRKSALELRTETIMERVDQARNDHGSWSPCWRSTCGSPTMRAREREDFPFDVGSWSETLADSYLALGRVDDAVRVITDATRAGHEKNAEMLCELGEKLMRSGHEPQASDLWRQACTSFPDDVWIYVQAGIEYGDLDDHGTALAWLTPGRSWRCEPVTPSPLSNSSSRCVRESSAIGGAADALQRRAEMALAGTTGHARGE